MIYTREQRQIAYKKLPVDIQDLIMSNETSELITNALKETGLNEEQGNLADSEILDAMFCLQSLDDAINNIAKLSSKSVSDLSKLKSTLQDEIFSKYEIDIKDFMESNKSGDIEKKDGVATTAPVSIPTPEPVVKTRPQSDTIVITRETKEDALKELTRREGLNNQNISTNLPEIAPEIHPVAQSAQPQPVASAPAEPKKENASLPDYRYKEGVDPYREPIA